MKEMVIIIRPEKLEKVKQIMDHEKLGGISISSVMGCGTQRGVEETGVQSAVPANLLPKIRVQIVLEDEKVEDIIARIRDEVATRPCGRRKDLRPGRGGRGADQNRGAWEQSFITDPERCDRGYGREKSDCGYQTCK